MSSVRFSIFMPQRNETFVTGIIDVFRKLSWDYKTNNPCRLGKKIILEGVLSRTVSRNRYASVRTECAELD
ncbi:DUF4942 domain-containing protein [Klebsiella pneumoniae]